MATLLGFLDDVFDIWWRHKSPVPIIASISHLMAYFSERGNANVAVYITRSVPWIPVLITPSQTDNTPIK